MFFLTTYTNTYLINFRSKTEATVYTTKSPEGHLTERQIEIEESGPTTKTIVKDYILSTISQLKISISAVEPITEEKTYNSHAITDNQGFAY